MAGQGQGQWHTKFSCLTTGWPAGYRGAVRCSAIFALLLLAAGCVRLPDVSPPPARPASSARAPGPSDLPGTPVVRELDTRRAYVVRLSEPALVEVPGRLRVFAPNPGASVTVDGGEQQVLPLNSDLEPGRHHMVVTCPDGTVETYQVAVESEATVHLRVCAQPMGP